MISGLDKCWHQDGIGETDLSVWMPNMKYFSPWRNVYEGFLHSDSSKG